MATHQPIISNKTACVIGGTGFVASLLIKLLLEKGYAVKTTARDPGQNFFIYLTNSTYNIWLTLFLLMFSLIFLIDHMLLEHQQNIVMHVVTEKQLTTNGVVLRT